MLYESMKDPKNHMNGDLLLHGLAGFCIIFVEYKPLNGIKEYRDVNKI